MSRIANYPVELPEKVEVTIGADQISVKGPLGSMLDGALAGSCGDGGAVFCAVALRESPQAAASAIMLM